MRLSRRGGGSKPAERPHHPARCRDRPRALRKSGPDPVVYLVGGPGGIALGEVDLVVAAGFNRNRDLVLMNQRGTFQTEPALTCASMDAFSRDLLGLRYYSNATEVVVDGGALIDWLRKRSYNTPSLRAAPDLIERARRREAGIHRGHRPGSAGGAPPPSPGDPAVGYGLSYGVVCREWFPPATPEEWANAGREAFPGYPIRGNLIPSANLSTKTGAAPWWTLAKVRDHILTRADRPDQPPCDDDRHFEGCLAQRAGAAPPEGS